MSIDRSLALNSIKHVKHRGAYTGATFNRQMNVIAGGVRTTFPEDRGIRVSGFEILDWDLSPNPKITFDFGAFIHADSSGDHRGVIVEETGPITLENDGSGDVPNPITTGTDLTLWAWTNDNYAAGVNQNANYRVAPTSSPPVAHAVCLARTTTGTQPGSFRWQNCGGVSLIDLNQRLDDAVSTGGTRRDFVHIAQNYHAAYPDYQFMTFQDFAFTDDHHGAWKAALGDETKFDTDNRNLRVGTEFVESMPFLGGNFLVGGGPSYYSLAGIRVVWTEQSVDGGGQTEPSLQYTSKVALVDDTFVEGVGPYIVQASGVSQHDVDIPIDPPVSLDPGVRNIRVRIETQVPHTTTMFQRMILLGRVVES